MPLPADVRALHVIADTGRQPLVASAQEAGVSDASLRNLQLEGLIVVMDHKGHPTIRITAAGQRTLRRPLSLFSA